MIHLSSSGLFSYGTSRFAGSKSSMLEYSTKKLYIFLSVPKNLLCTSLTPSSSNLVGVQAGETETRYQRMTSAPYLLIISNGSTVFPTCLDIFLPFASRIRSLTRTFLYGALSIINVEIAINE